MHPLVSLPALLCVVLFVTSCGSSPRLRREAHAVANRAATPGGGASAREVQQVCWGLARQRLRYTFGSCRPEKGGMDCSGTVHYVFSKVGYRNVPRQSNHQYLWVKERGRMHHARHLSEAVLRKMRPGDLLFWQGTYRTGKRWPNISHVMIYSGMDKKSGRHFMFGGRSNGQRGQNGAEVDFFILKPGESEGRRGKFVGYGTPPGLKR